MTYLTEEEFKKVTTERFKELLNHSFNQGDYFNQMIAKILNPGLHFLNQFYFIDDAKPEKNKLTENLIIGRRDSALKFFEIKFNLKTNKILSTASEEKHRIFHGKKIVDPLNNEVSFLEHLTISQELVKRDFTINH